MRHLKLSLIVYTLTALFSIVCLGITASAQAYSTDTYLSPAKARGTFIFNIIDYIEWKNLKENTVTLCMTSYDNATQQIRRLNAIAPHHYINVRVRQVFSISEMGMCNIIYISNKTAPDKITGYIEESIKQRIVSLSNIEDFVSKGGMISFTIKRRRVRLAINRPVLQQTKIRVNPMLLEITR